MLSSLSVSQRVALSQPPRKEQPRIPPVDGESYMAGQNTALQRSLLSDEEIAQLSSK